MISRIRITALGFAMVLHLGCSTNQPCTVPMEQSPELRGFRLGMNLSDIQKRFSGFPNVSANEIGVATVEISNDYVKNVLNEARGENVVSSLGVSEFPELSELKHLQLK